MTYSVIVPIYKVEQYLRKCIDSILNQSFSDFELILVDDGSLDKCPEICDEYDRQDNRVKVIHKANGGLVSARNAGLRLATGDYICYVDGDDWINEDLLKIIYNEAIKCYNPDMVIFGIVKKFIDDDLEILNDLPEGIYEKDQMKRLVYPYMMYDSRKPFCKGLIFPAACNKIYSRKLLSEHYCTNERIRMGEDNAFVFECVYFSEKIYICNKILYYYNQHPGAMNHSYDKTRFENNKILYDYMEERLGGINEELDGQLNAFRAYWLIMAVFHEIKSGNKMLPAANHIRKKIAETQMLSYINFSGLPKSAILFILILKLRGYYLALIAAALVQKKR